MNRSIRINKYLFIEKGKGIEMERTSHVAGNEI